MPTSMNLIREEEVYDLTNSLLWQITKAGEEMAIRVDYRHFNGK